MAPSDPAAVPLALPLPHVATATTPHDGLTRDRERERDRERDDAEVERAVLQLFDRYQRPLTRYVASLGLSAVDAEDVVQEVYLALFRHLANHRPATNLPAWLFQVARNLGLRQRLRGRRWWRWFQPADPAMVDRPDPAAGPELLLTNAEQYDQWQRILQALPDRDRQILLLRAEGLSYRDIGQALGVSLGLVAKSLARALARFERAEASR